MKAGNSQIGKPHAIAAWDMGMAVFRAEPYEEIQSRTELDKDPETELYEIVVGENQFETAKKLLLEHLRNVGYEPKEVSLEKVANQMALHYTACLENHICEKLLQPSVKDSIEVFLTICEPLEEYDGEV